MIDFLQRMLQCLYWVGLSDFSSISRIFFQPFFRSLRDTEDIIFLIQVLEYLIFYPLKILKFHLAKRVQTLFQYFRRQKYLFTTHTHTFTFSTCMSCMVRVILNQLKKHVVKDRLFIYCRVYVSLPHDVSRPCCSLYKSSIYYRPCQNPSGFQN